MGYRLMDEEAKARAEEAAKKLAEKQRQFREEQEARAKNLREQYLQDHPEAR